MRFMQSGFMAGLMLLWATSLGTAAETDSSERTAQQAGPRRDFGFPRWDGRAGGFDHWRKPSDAKGREKKSAAPEHRRQGKGPKAESKSKKDGQRKQPGREGDAAGRKPGNPWMRFGSFAGHPQGKKTDWRDAEPSGPTMLRALLDDAGPSKRHQFQGRGPAAGFHRFAAWQGAPRGAAHGHFGMSKHRGGQFRMASWRGSRHGQGKHCGRCSFAAHRRKPGMRHMAGWRGHQGRHGQFARHRRHGGYQMARWRGGRGHHGHFARYRGHRGHGAMAMWRGPRGRQGQFARYHRGFHGRHGMMAWRGRYARPSMGHFARYRSGSGPSRYAFWMGRGHGRGQFGHGGPGAAFGGDFGGFQKPLPASWRRGGEHRPGGFKPAPKSGAPAPRHHRGGDSRRRTGDTSPAKRDSSVVDLERRIDRLMAELKALRQELR